MVFGDFTTYAKPGGWGRQYASDIENYRNVAGLWIVGEDMPQESNRIALHDTKKDQYGLPIPSVNYKDHPNDTAMRNHAWEAASDVYKGSKYRLYKNAIFFHP